MFWSILLRNNRPTRGTSPSTGTLSLTFWMSSRTRPPSTTVEPSYTLTLVDTLRVSNTGWLMVFGVSTLVVEMPRALVETSESGCRS